MQPTNPKIIIALDFDSREEVLSFITSLNPELCRLKIGSILFTRCGPSLVQEIMQQGFDVFLDLKFHDIPNTVAGACRAAAELGVWMLTVHASGGETMLRAAQEAVQQFNHSRTMIVGVTVLTSFAENDLASIGMQEAIPETVTRLAKLAQSSGIAGVVCSPLEISLLRPQLPANFLLVTPGIRLESNSKDDQKRVMTPEAAIAAGADYIVIGRAITEAANPLAVLQDIQNRILETQSV